MFSDERPYKCNSCDGRFKRKSHLSIHMLIHSGGRPYKCTVSNKHFIHNHHLTRHMRVNNRK